MTARRIALSWLAAALIAPPTDARPGPAWKPAGALADVLVVDDCNETAGDAMVSRLDPPTIYICPRVVALMKKEAPGAELFFRAHEYGHIALQTSSEAFADCWAARALIGSAAGQRAIAAAAAMFARRGGPGSARYGTPGERADHIRNCADEARRDPGAARD